MVEELPLMWGHAPQSARNRMDPLGTTQRHNEQQLVGTHRQHHWCGVGTRSPTGPHQVMALLSMGWMFCHHS